jgi:O-glycosyl hydrolase
MIKTIALLLCGLIPACFATEHATYDSAGGLTALIAKNVELPVHGEFRVTFSGGVSAALQPDDQRSNVTRAGPEPHWNGNAVFPNGTKATYTANWTESETGVALDGTAAAVAPFPGPMAARFPLDVASVDYVVDLPRETFAGGKIEPSGTVLPVTKPEDPVFFRDTAGALTFVDAKGNWTLALSLDQPRPVSITDRWDKDGRSYRVTIRLHQGPWLAGEPVKLGLAFKLSGTPVPAAAHLTVNPAEKLGPFDGFGGNYRVFMDSPVTEYTLKNLHLSWARLSFNAVTWDRERAKPGPELVRDGELAQCIQRLGVPWILSLWFLPETYYADPNRQPFGSFGRHLAPERWPDFLDLLGSYLAYLKNNYGSEPDLFSFNEPDLGVDLGFTPETHRDAIRRIGAFLAARGLKTKLLLGDTANPRDTHNYVLAAAADPEAMRYVGAVSFHSWGNGTPAQYGAWADVASWLHRPLLVAEAGVDPGAWHSRIFDSYAYGLREARQFQELLRDARPQALLYWQFTDDYSLVHVSADGAVEPTSRFWLMKQFTDLTPVKSELVATTSDQAGVLASAFARGDAITVHILNVGPDCTASMAGLPSGRWRFVTTTETAGYQESVAGPGNGPAPTTLHLPARSLTTLVREQAAAP